MKEIVLVFAGYDQTSGAGVLADARTITCIGAHPVCITTSFVIQNTKGVKEVIFLDPSIIEKHINILDVKPKVVKIGVAGDENAIKLISKAIDTLKPDYVVLDTPLFSKNDTPLFQGIELFKELIVSKASVITPNIKEASFLTGIKIKNKEDIEQAADILLDMGPKHVIIKGGHREDEPGVDFYKSLEEAFEIKKDFIETRNTHGTGCVYASAIASYLALGNDIKASIVKAKDYVDRAIKQGYRLNYDIDAWGVLNIFTP
ncbi:bifunctional hydroxymethylpyrimidine kinase/phosphomethylpyrimidine kinase [Hydrogenobaculum acidophilum]